MKRIQRRQFIKRGLLYLPLVNILVPTKAQVVGPGSVTRGTAGTAQRFKQDIPSGGGGGGASITFISKNHNVQAASMISTTVTLTGVTAGNLIIVGQKSELATAGDITSISDGTSTFSLATETEHTVDGGNLRWRFGYLLSSVASGNLTYTVTRAANSEYNWTFAMEFSYSGGTAALDTENGAFGTDTAPASGSITTGAAKTVCLGGYAHYSGVTISSMQIGGAAADGSEPATPGASESSMWYKILSSAGAGAASGTLSGSSAWVCRVLSIKVI